MPPTKLCVIWKPCSTTRNQSNHQQVWFSNKRGATKMLMRLHTHTPFSRSFGVFNFGASRELTCAAAHLHLWLVYLARPSNWCRCLWRPVKHQPEISTGATGWNGNQSISQSLGEAQLEASFWSPTQAHHGAHQAGQKREKKTKWRRVTDTRAVDMIRWGSCQGRQQVSLCLIEISQVFEKEAKVKSFPICEALDRLPISCTQLITQLEIFTKHLLSLSLFQALFVPRREKPISQLTATRGCSKCACALAKCWIFEPRDRIGLYWD